MRKLLPTTSDVPTITTDRERMVTALGRLAVATREKLDAGVYDVYLEVLAEYPTEVVECACKNLCRSAKWFPKLNEILDLCGDIEDGLEAIERKREFDEAQRRLPPPDPERLVKFMKGLAKPKVVK